MRYLLQLLTFFRKETDVETDTDTDNDEALPNTEHIRNKVLRVGVVVVVLAMLIVALGGAFNLADKGLTKSTTTTNCTCCDLCVKAPPIVTTTPTTATSTDRPTTTKSETPDFCPQYPLAQAFVAQLCRHKTFLALANDAFDRLPRIADLPVEQDSNTYRTQNQRRNQKLNNALLTLSIGNDLVWRDVHHRGVRVRDMLWAIMVDHTAWLVMCLGGEKKMDRLTQCHEK